jgi:redox-sensitive bicupin YhaK (pirin superfamily)
MSKTVLHKAASRGHANHDWARFPSHIQLCWILRPKKSSFRSALRVLNDDIVQGSQGFGTHPHDNMEIISIPLKGALEHQDNTGRHGVIKAGGRTNYECRHRYMRIPEYNASETEDVNFLQIWIFPNRRNIQPSYDQKTFYEKDRQNVWQLVVSPSENNGALTINQDAWISLADLKQNHEIDYQIKKNGNGVYVFVIDGSVTINGEELDKRDGFGIWDTEKFFCESRERCTGIAPRCANDILNVQCYVS